MTFGPDGITYHPDHIAVHRGVTAAWRERGGPGELLYAATTVEHLNRFRDMYEEWHMYMSDERPVGVPADELSVHVRLAGDDLDRKLTALRALAAQTAGVIDMIGAETYAEQVCEEAYVAAERVARTERSALAPFERSEPGSLRPSPA